MKLKIELFRYETLVFGKILEQDGIERGCEKICEKDEYSIYSIDSPAINEMDRKTLFIRGERYEKDNIPIFQNFDSKSEAIEWCENIKGLIDEINEDETKKDKIEKVI